MSRTFLTGPTLFAKYSYKESGGLVDLSEYAHFPNSIIIIQARQNGMWLVDEKVQKPNDDDIKTGSISSASQQ